MLYYPHKSAIPSILKLVLTSSLIAAHTSQESTKGWVTHIMRLNKVSRAAPRQDQTWIERAGKGASLGFHGTYGGGGGQSEVPTLVPMWLGT